MHEKLRIIQAIPDLGKGGAERLVIDICRQLHILSDVEYRLVIFTNTNEYKSLTHGLNIIYCPVSVNTFRLNSRKNNLKEWFKLVEEFKPDIIHSHIYFADLITKARVEKNILYVSHVHGRTSQFEIPPLKLMIKKPIAFLMKHFERFYILNKYFAAKSIIITVSKYYEQHLKECIGLKKKIFVLPNAINLDLFNKSTNKCNRESIRLLSIGRLVEKKNHRLLILLAKDLLDKRLDFKLDILGNGPLKNELHELIVELNMESFIRLKGNVDKPEYYYKKADVYVHSAFDEPFGLTIIEAMASGLPVVCFDAGGNRDYMRDNENGFIIKNNTEGHKLFVDRILQLTQSRELYKRISEEGLKTASEFGIKSYVNKLLKIYAEFSK
jgi:glycosyltransferase involved in cell wall biosynthesis